MSALLEVEGLHAGYGPVNVLEDVSFGVDEGETVALLGANGAGKTTTLRAICGMVTPARHGHDRAARDVDRPLDRADRPARRRPRARGPRHVRAADRRGEPAPRRLRTPQRRRARVDRARLRALPAPRGAPHQRAGTLSGGEQQMLAIAPRADAASRS